MVMDRIDGLHQSVSKEAVEVELSVLVLLIGRRFGTLNTCEVLS